MDMDIENFRRLLAGKVADDGSGNVTLDLSGCELDSLPARFGALPEVAKVTCLYLSSNKLSTLPDSIREMKAHSATYPRRRTKKNVLLR